MLGEKLRAALDLLQHSALDRDAIKAVTKELQRALIASDVPLDLVLDLSKKIEDFSNEKLPSNITMREHLIKRIYDNLADLLGGDYELPQAKRILLVGLFGTGKTTTTARLAKWYAKRGKSVLVVCADTFRPASYEQLQQLSEKAQVTFYGEKNEKLPYKIVQNALQKFKDKEIIIVDSAGRNALDKEMVDEVKDMHKVFNADQNWLVFSADIGQVANKQAKAFHDAIGVNGIIITKMDGSAKGGGALAACHQTKAPVYFIGVGERLEDLEQFNATRYLGRIMGYGDLQSLLEKTAELSEDEELSPEDLLKGDFTLKTFYKQLEMAKKIGPFGKIAEMLGMKQHLQADQLKVGEEKLKSYKVIMDSMTPQELNDPDLLSKQRIHRVAKGSGKPESEVRELIKQYNNMAKMFKQFSKLNEKDLQNMDQTKMQRLMKKMQFGGKKKRLLVR
ncbi:MAG: signal recognition particle protein [Candidatus Diapherotrites archaeon CG08_land_8_20_14_0_20_34_12]|nr:MAG: signal recognition particle protein [Candidatus Diapherotrites archaeon CG08_land_8_20_14_0_20_34_12]